MDIEERSYIMEILEMYSKWLLEHNYLDADFYAEPPSGQDKSTIDVFMEELVKQN